MSSIATEHLFEKIYEQINNKNGGWRCVLEYGTSLEIECKRKLLWVWPNLANLKNMGKLFKELSISRILSVGCGSGVLEWLMGESLGLEVYGLEIDRNWWQSGYTVKSFIPLNFVDDMLALKQSKNREFLQNCCGVTNWAFALLFCYFNNHQAFLHYVELYQGDWIIIIGPNSKLNTFVYSEPMPLQPNFIDPEKKWQLTETLCIGEHDVLALYKRN